MNVSVLRAESRVAERFGVPQRCLVEVAVVAALRLVTSQAILSVGARRLAVGLEQKLGHVCLLDTALVTARAVARVLASDCVARLTALMHG
jgi:hypothetical protein